MILQQQQQQQQKKQLLKADSIIIDFHFDYSQYPECHREKSAKPKLSFFKGNMETSWVSYLLLDLRWELTTTPALAEGGEPSIWDTRLQLRVLVIRDSASRLPRVPRTVQIPHAKLRNIFEIF